jgi:ribA/ribD-fused uncharacterized protein
MNLFEDKRIDTPILGFFGEYRFLSNYHLCTCLVYDIPFKSSEHAYMYQKSFDPEYQQMIICAETPKDAKKIGSKVTLRPDWNDYRKTAMLIALQAKFRNIPERNMLLATGDAYLEETNYWKDTYWGKCDGIGHNNLGEMLMKIRNNSRIT